MYPLILLLACSPTELTPVASNTCAPGVWVDEDGDGASPCAALAARRDCDDRDPTTRPEAPERCDGLDDDCDGRVPDAELDLDGDGEPLCAGDCDDARADLQHADLDGDGYGTCDGDVDDDDDGVFPGGPELCNGRDDDGDGVVPPTEFDRDGDGDLACATDCDDGDPAVDGLDRDGDGATSCGGDCDDLDPGRSALTPETCNGRDDDCDGDVDEECP